MFQVGADDVAFFEAHGWFNTPPIVPAETIAGAVAAVARFYEGERACELPPVIRASSNWSPDQGNVLRLNEFIVQQCRGVARLVLTPAIGAAAAALLGVRGVRVFSSTLVCKPPDLAGPAGTVGWHADAAYWLTCSARMITAWIPLADCDEEMGTLLMVDGSHRWREEDAAVQRLRLGRSFRGDAAPQVWASMSAVAERLEVVPMNLTAGQVHFHDGRALHGSDVNRSTSARMAVVVELQELDNRYRPAADPHNERPYVCNTDRVCRRVDGQPDYTDPFFCPVVWDGAAAPAAPDL